MGEVNEINCAIRHTYTLCDYDTDLFNVTDMENYITSYFATQTAVAESQITVAIPSPATPSANPDGEGADSASECLDIVVDISAEDTLICPDRAASYSIELAFDESINDSLTLEQLVLVSAGIVSLVIAVAFLVTVIVVCQRLRSLNQSWILPSRPRVSNKTSGSLPPAFIYPTSESKLPPVRDDPYSIDSPPRPGAATSIPNSERTPG